MQLQLLPARQGIAWMQQGLRTFWRRPDALLGLFALNALALWLPGLLGWPGMALSTVLLPALALGMMAAARDVHTNAVAAPLRMQWLWTTLLAAWHLPPAQRTRMGVLGLAYCACLALSLAASALADGGGFVRLQLLGQQDMTPQELMAMMQSTAFMVAMLLAALGLSATGMLFWHAPALVAWRGLGVGKSLFFSLMACLRNFKAFALYILCWSGLFMGLVFALLALQEVPVLGQAVLAPVFLQFVLLLFWAMFATSVWFSWRDCFEPPSAAPPSPTPAHAP